MRYGRRERERRLPMTNQNERRLKRTGARYTLARGWDMIMMKKYSFRQEFGKKTRIIVSEAL